MHSTRFCHFVTSSHVNATLAQLGRMQLGRVVRDVDQKGLFDGCRAFMQRNLSFFSHAAKSALSKRDTVVYVHIYGTGSGGYIIIKTSCSPDLTWCQEWMATALNLQGLPPPMPADGDLAGAWRKWKKRFMIYLKATRQAGDDTPDDIKTSVLLHATGDDGQEAFETFDFADEEEKEKFAPVLEKFEKYYIPKTNLTCERYRFLTRNQEIGETVDKYVTDLRKLAQTCEFGTIRDSLIRDRLVLGLRDHRVTKRLLSAGDPNLDKAFEICRSEEMAVAQTKRMDDVERKANVDAVVTARGEDELETISAVQRQQDSRQSGKKECTRCGRKHAFRKCPAWGNVFEMSRDESFCTRVSHKNGELSDAGKRMRTKGKSEGCDPAPAGDQRERAQVTTAERKYRD